MPVNFSGSYTQTFDSLANTGTSNSWTNDNTILGWYSSRPLYIAGTGSINTGALYSFGAAATTERALGSVASGTTTTIYYGVRLQNNTGSPINSLSVGYTGEQWRNGGNTTSQTLDFSYQTGANLTSLTTGMWTDVNVLDFTGPIATATAASLDGNLATNRVVLPGTTINLATPLAVAEEIVFRWQDINNTGFDHGLAIDDFSVSVPAQPDLTISSSAPANATVNTPFDYTLTLGNAGTGNATGVSAQFTLPAGVTYNSASGTGFTVSQAVGVVTFSGGSVNVGTPVNLTVNVTPTTAATVTSATGAAVIDPGNAIAETNETNNSSPTAVTTTVTLGAPSVRIRNIQGASHTSSLATQTVSNVPGVVTAVIATGSSRGFYIQDPTPDTEANPDSTSEGIFVFLGNSAIANPTIGQSVQVTGRVDEFRPGSDSNNLTVTQINATVSGAAVGAIASLGTITPTIIGNGGRTQPTTSIQMILLLLVMSKLAAILTRQLRASTSTKA